MLWRDIMMSQIWVFFSASATWETDVVGIKTGLCAVTIIQNEQFSHSNRDNVAGAGGHREARVHQHLPEQLHVPLVFQAQRPTFLPFQHPDGLLGSSQQHGGQRRGEDEASGVRAHCVHQGGGTGNVASHAAKRLPWNTNQVREIKIRHDHWASCLPSVPEITSILCVTLSLSPIPPPLGPYKPTAWTSSTNVMAPNLWATSQSSSRGHTEPDDSTAAIHGLKTTRLDLLAPNRATICQEKPARLWLRVTAFSKKKKKYIFLFSVLHTYQSLSARSQRQLSSEWRGQTSLAAGGGGRRHCGGR